MVIRDTNGWQVILADLSLILFLVTVTSLAQTFGQDPAEDNPDPSYPPRSDVAPSQAIYRPSRSGPELGEWLKSQTVDPRATLSVIATHKAGGSDEAWTRAKAMAEQARKQGHMVRVVVIPAGRDDLYASLAYDTPR